MMTPGDLFSSTLHKINSGLWLPANSFAGLDLDSILDMRELETGFDARWMQAFDVVEAAWQQRKSSKTEQQKLASVVEAAFKACSHASKGHDIAGFIADDIELMLKASLLGLHLDFIANLWLCYEAGHIPSPDVMAVS